MPDAAGPQGLQGLQLDLATAILRIEQLARQDYFDCGDFIWHRIVTCDLPRLTGHLTPETREWLDRMGEVLTHA